MTGKSPYVIKLNPQEQNKLEEISRKYTSTYNEVVRAKFILLKVK